MVKKYLHEHRKHTVTKHLAKKIKDSIHNRNHVSYFKLNKVTFMVVLPKNTTHFMDQTIPTLSESYW